MRQRPIDQFRPMYAKLNASLMLVKTLPTMRDVATAMAALRTTQNAQPRTPHDGTRTYLKGQFCVSTARAKL